MKINKNKVVALTYTLVVDGVEADKCTEERPLDFIYGTGSLLPKFEEYLLDKEANDEYAFVLSPVEGYGEIDPRNVVELPKHIFERDGQIQPGLLTIGNVIQMMNNQGGIMLGKVVEVKDASVMMDFNHQMAGKELHFSGKIISVRDATEQELAEGLHGELKRHTCGGECSDDCCSSCGGGCH